MRWDLFCRVVDNYGDIGVCWRLAADLGSRGEAVRLFVDDASALAWLAPDGANGVSVRAWTEAHEAEPGDVVVEAFGCDPPDAFVARMAARARAPAWIDLEYLSAEAYVERSHGLSSPVMAGPGKGLVKWFHYPGFTPRTGGLIREPWLVEEQAGFDRDAWLAAHGVERRADERVVSLFCYPDAPVDTLIDALSRTAPANHGNVDDRNARTPDACVPSGAKLAPADTLLLATPGAATTLARAALGDSMQRGALRCRTLPFLAQRDYDRLLRACDLNVVRGEDSFVRAQWAGRPFVWQAYRQDDDLHLDKVDAFLDRHLDGAPAALAAALRRLWRDWNGGTAPLPHALAVPAFDADGDWHRHAATWRAMLTAQPDLTHGLMHRAAELVRLTR